MLNVKEFWYRTFSKALENVKEIEKEESIEDAVVVFANIEEEDEEKASKIIRKAVKNITWLAGKTGRDRIVLHSFTHLSSSKSSTDFAQETFQNLEDRLKRRGYEVFVTPFGYCLEFRIHVLGPSLAKVWKDIS
ncbi:MAG: threonyl-tRNA synthetase editing domain-containing protein [Candidatus Bathyarchaeia archaeon]